LTLTLDGNDEERSPSLVAIGNPKIHQASRFNVPRATNEAATHCAPLSDTLLIRASSCFFCSSLFFC
jgi:hypothetical protein